MQHARGGPRSGLCNLASLSSEILFNDVLKIPKADIDENLSGVISQNVVYDEKAVYINAREIKSDTTSQSGMSSCLGMFTNNFGILNKSIVHRSLVHFHQLRRISAVAPAVPRSTNG